MNKIIVLIVVLVIAVTSIGIFSLTGMITEPDDESNIEKIMNSAEEWLGTGEGIIHFNGDGIVDEVFTIYVGNTSDVFYWQISIKNNEGLYLGAIISDVEEFVTRNIQILKLNTPRNYMFTPTSDEAFYQMVSKYTEYSAGQLSKPKLIAQNAVIYWKSEDTENNIIINIV